MDKEELKENIAKIWNETERLRIANANGARDKDLDSFYRGRLSMYKELKEAGCVILDREKLKKLPECPYRRTEFTSAGVDIYIQAYKTVQQADAKHFEDSIEELI